MAEADAERLAELQAEIVQAEMVNELILQNELGDRLPHAEVDWLEEDEEDDGDGFPPNYPDFLREEDTYPGRPPRVQRDSSGIVNHAYPRRMGRPRDLFPIAQMSAQEQTEFQQRASRRSALTLQAAPGNGDGPRERALRSLADMAENMNLIEEYESHGLAGEELEWIRTFYTRQDLQMSGDSSLEKLFWDEHKAVIIPAATDTVVAVRIEALRALTSIADKEPVALLMWADEAGARAAFLAGGASGQPEDVRIRSIAALSLIAGSKDATVSFWQHTPTRELVLSTARNNAGPAASQAELSVRLEAWDCLNNSVTLRSAHGTLRRGIIQVLWGDLEGENGDRSSDVRAVVESTLSDPEEDARVKMKALGFVTNLLKFCKVYPVLSVNLITHMWTTASSVAQSVISCTDPARTEVSAARVRTAALRLLVSLLPSAAPEPLRPDGTSEAAWELPAIQESEVTRILLLAIQGPDVVPDRSLRESCEAQYARLEMISASRADSAGGSASLPLRSRPRYAGLSLEERHTRVRRVWEDASRGKGRIVMDVHVGSICDDMLHLVAKLKVARANILQIHFQLDHGTDAGGLSRHCFAEFGKGLLEVTAVSSSAHALSSIHKLLKGWRTPLRADPVEEARLIRQVQQALTQATAVAENSSNGGGGEASGHGPPDPKRQKVTPNPVVRLFKVTESGSLVPSGAETLCGGVGQGTDRCVSSPQPEVAREDRSSCMLADIALFIPLLRALSLSLSLSLSLARPLSCAPSLSWGRGAIVPKVNSETLERYRAIGRMSALALTNNMNLGLPFARYFLRLVLGEPPQSLAELQEELEEEDPVAKRGRSDFLATPLEEQGMAGILNFRSQTSVALGSDQPMGFEAPLARNPSEEVTDTNKEDYIRRALEHQLVRTIEQQAQAFRKGVEEITGAGWLALLSAGELKTLWGGHALDDANLEKWKQRTTARGGAVEQRAALFWTWLGGCTEAKRAEVLQFATGAARLPSDSQLSSWTFSIEALDSHATITPTESNGLSAPAKLARASTCSKTLYLPPYTDVEDLARGMERSLMDGGFGRA